MKKPNAAPLPLAIPTPDSRSVALQQMRAKELDLQTQKGMLGGEASVVEARVRTGASLTRESDNRVALLLGDPVADFSDDYQRLRSIERQVRDIDAALATLATRIREAEVAASREICGDLRETYDQKVRSLAMAIAAATKAQIELEDYTDSITRAGVTWASWLRPMSAAPIVGLERTETYLGEAAAFGFLSPEEQP